MKKVARWMAFLLRRCFSRFCLLADSLLHFFLCAFMTLLAVADSPFAEGRPSAESWAFRWHTKFPGFHVPVSLFSRQGYRIEFRLVNMNEVDEIVHLSLFKLLNTNLQFKSTGSGSPRFVVVDVTHCSESEPPRMKSAGRWKGQVIGKWMRSREYSRYYDTIPIKAAPG